MTAENIGPADEWGTLKEQIKAAEERLAVLRPVLLKDREARRGKRYVVTLSSFDRNYVDIDHELLERDFPEAYAATVSIVTRQQTKLNYSGITEDGEIVSPGAMRRILAEQEAK